MQNELPKWVQTIKKELDKEMALYQALRRVSRNWKKPLSLWPNELMTLQEREVLDL